MSYNSSTGIITAPVSIKDVGDALSVPSGDLGTLCRNVINKWSIKKPHFLEVVKPVVHIDYDNNIMYFLDGTTGVPSEYVIIDDYPHIFGLRFVTCNNVMDKLSVPNTLSDLVEYARYYSAFKNNLKPFYYPIAQKYDNLHGFRLTDFVGYYKNSKENSLIGCQLGLYGTYEPTPTSGAVGVWSGTYNINDDNSGMSIADIIKMENNLTNGYYNYHDNITPIINFPLKAITDSYYNTGFSLNIRLETLAEKSSGVYYSLDYILNRMFSWGQSGNNNTKIILAVSVKNTSNSNYTSNAKSVYSYANTNAYPKPLNGTFIDSNKGKISSFREANSDYYMWRGATVTYLYEIGRWNSTNRKYEFSNNASHSNISYKMNNGILKYITCKLEHYGSSYYPIPQAISGQSNYYEIAIALGFSTDNPVSINYNQLVFPCYGYRYVICFSGT